MQRRTPPEIEHETGRDVVVPAKQHAGRERAQDDPQGNLLYRYFAGNLVEIRPGRSPAFLASAAASNDDC